MAKTENSIFCKKIEIDDTDQCGGRREDEDKDEDEDEDEDQDFGLAFKPFVINFMLQMAQVG